MTTQHPTTMTGGTDAIGVDDGMTGSIGTSNGGAGQPPEAAITSTVADTAQQVAHQAQERAGEIVQRATDRGREQLTTHKGRAAEGLQTLAQATRRVGYDLRARDNTAIADITDTAAAQAERLGTFLRQTEVNDMVRGVTQFGRTQPWVFLGGAFVLGVVGARFLKASAQQAAQPETGETDLELAAPASTASTASTRASTTGSRQPRSLTRMAESTTAEASQTRTTGRTPSGA